MLQKNEGIFGFYKTLTVYLLNLHFARSFIFLKHSDNDSLLLKQMLNQRTNGPVNAHLTPWPSKAQNIQILENIW